MTNPLSAPLDDFKDRELEILNMMADGLTNREIAEKLFITKETVRWYNKQIYSKLGTSRRTEAIALARSMGLIGQQQEPEPATEPARLYKLPVTNGPFIGRDADLTELTTLLQKPEVRLVSIVAAGGMGKSRLSLELAHQIWGGYEWGAAFIDLTPIRRPEGIAEAALQTLGIPVDGKQPPAEQLLNYCREKHLLLIFDNMEHVLDGAGLLADLLQTAPKLKLIATSRERLNLRVETVYYLDAVTENARQLFTEVAAVMRPNIAFADNDQPPIERITTLVGGMPLALILAASWVDVLTPDEIADEIEHSLDFLSAELADMPSRQRSIRAVIEPTWKRLSEAEQQAFMWASVFRGGFTREMFQQVAGASVRVLQKLLSRSLIMHGNQRHYDMHPLLRQYGREKLDASGDFASAKAAHLRTVLGYVQEQNALMFSGGYVEALDNLAAEQDNYRAALDWALAHHAVADGTQLAVALCMFWEVRSHANEAANYLNTALQHRLPPPLQAQVLCWRSRFHYRLGQMDEARADAEQAIALAGEDKATLARSLVYLAYLLPHAEERKMTEEAVQISKDLQNDQLIAMSLNAIGVSYAKQGAHLQALTYYEQAQEYYEALGDLRGLSVVVYNAGLEHEGLQDAPRARQHYEASLELKRQIGDRAGIARRLSVLAYNDLMNEDFEQAATRIEESRLLCEEVGDRLRWVYATMTEAMMAFIMTDFQQAHTTLERGLVVAQELNEDERICEYHHLLGMVYLSQNQIQQAEAAFIECLKAAVRAQRPYTNWLSLSGYASFLWTTQQSEQSVRMLAVAHRLRSHGGDFDRRYLLDPHVYRAERRIGKDVWQAIQQETASITLEQMFTDVTQQIGL